MLDVARATPDFSSWSAHYFQKLSLLVCVPSINFVLLTELSCNLDRYNIDVTELSSKLQKYNLCYSPNYHAIWIGILLMLQNPWYAKYISVIDINWQYQRGCLIKQYKIGQNDSKTLNDLNMLNEYDLELKIIVLFFVLDNWKLPLWPLYK